MRTDYSEQEHCVRSARTDLKTVTCAREARRTPLYVVLHQPCSIPPENYETLHFRPKKYPKLGEGGTLLETIVKMQKELAG